jgi:hypothetical protein
MRHTKPDSLPIKPCQFMMKRISEISNRTEMDFTQISCESKHTLGDFAVTHSVHKSHQDGRRMLFGSCICAWTRGIMPLRRYLTGRMAAASLMVGLSACQPASPPVSSNSEPSKALPSPTAEGEGGERVVPVPETPPSTPEPQLGEPPRILETGR